MQNTFLDINTIHSRSFVLYGKTNENFYLNDLTVLSLEDYLVQLLKSRGYDEVVFYESNRGAYCLDCDSAKRFFGDNKDSSAPSSTFDPEDNRTNESAVPDKAERRKKGSSDIRALMDNQEKNSGASASPVPERGGEGNASFRVAARGRTETQFIGDICNKIKMGNKFVAVFSNFSTGNFNEPAFRDMISHGLDGSQGLIIFIVRDSNFNNNILERLENLFGYKFVYRENNEIKTNKRTCINISYPKEDELINMYRRLSIVGTKARKKIRFDYSDLDEMVSRTIKHSRLKATRKDGDDNGDEGYMCFVEPITEAYIDMHADLLRPLVLSPDIIDEIWNQKSADKTAAIDKLDKEGWENAKIRVKTALDIYNREAKRTGYVSVQDERDYSDVSVDRLRTEIFIQNENIINRPSIPNFVLLGPPGVGKTTIARIIGDVLREAGILKIGQFIETTRADYMADPYIGAVERSTNSCIDKAEGGVLFIDEAHSLAEGYYEHESNAGKTMASLLCAAMTNKANHNFSLIITSYKDKLEDVWKLDPGLKSRFGNNIIELEAYSPEMLKKILIRKLVEAGYFIDPSLINAIKDEESGLEYEPLGCFVERICAERNLETFGNARSMETIVEEVEMNHSGENASIVKADFYGQYNFLSSKAVVDETWFEPKDMVATYDSVLKKFSEECVGMENVKTVITDIALRMEELRASEVKGSFKGVQLIIAGNPGTGKTSVAETLAKVLYSLGVVGTPDVLKKEAGDLTGPHRNDTQAKVKSVIEEAINKQALLFIEEAHTLCDPDYKGVMSAFMAPTTDAEHPLNVCFAVYKNRLDEFKQLDDGEESRFEVIELEDYTAEQLYEIFRRTLKRNGRIIDDKTSELCKKIFERYQPKMAFNKGNGRFVNETFFEKGIETLRRRRCKEQGIAQGSDESKVIKIDDIPEKYRLLVEDYDANSFFEKIKDIKQRVNDAKVNASIKDILNNKIIELEYSRKYPEHAEPVEPGRYFLMGRPGTGKTTGAEFIGQILKELGVIERAEVNVRKASDLIAGFVGQTGSKTRAVLDGSRGGVLFIDEAYALACNDEWSGDSFKMDAVNELIGTLDEESFRLSTCVLFAGYPDEMEKLKKSNAGFSSRVTEIYFEDYTESDCISMFKKRLNIDKFLIDEAALEKCEQQISEMVKAQGFANGRTIREYANLLKHNLKERVTTADPEDFVDDNWGITIIDEDIPDIKDVIKELNIDE